MMKEETTAAGQMLGEIKRRRRTFKFALLRPVSPLIAAQTLATVRAVIKIFQLVESQTGG